MLENLKRHPELHPSVEWLGDQGDEMERMLAELVNIDSGSGDVEGIGRVASAIEAFLSAFGIPTEHVQTSNGAILRASIGNHGADRPRWLLLGHMDTVFTNGTAADRPFRSESGRAYGPGVADMKAGLVMNCFVIAGLARAGLQVPVTALFSCDEEVASPVSRRFIEEEARKADFILNSEPGRANGNIVVQRKGGLFLTLTTSGRAAHAGVDFEDGASAIEALAAKIVAMRELTNRDDGTTLNVGLIEGGTTVNTVASSALARIDLRYSALDKRKQLLEALQAITEDCSIPGTAATLQIDGEFLPMTPASASLGLLGSYKRSAAALGFETEGVATGGCSDAGFASALGVPTLCGVGPVGGHAHTENEYCDLSTLAPRAQAMALTILGHPEHLRDPSTPTRAQDSAPNSATPHSN
ncbi:M20 family metallopeptidase [Hoeflea sp.]|uniref:M20 family metallopeptidase n=1 Tax=Hoeflea sp. TaxID=1940281 RepID=UPI003B526DB5